MTAAATPRVTRGGKTLSARMWAFLEEAYHAAGADPARYLYVGQGSFRADDPTPASGTTHNGGGAADLRVWNLPDAVQANLCEKLVRELRRRGGCAWFRDEAHGGFAPHIHVILRDEPGGRAVRVPDRRPGDRRPHGPRRRSHGTAARGGHPAVGDVHRALHPAQPEDA